ncbi:MAG: NAD-dependent DNA ligase LigA [Treponema sp.]|jgi:DNA ligase (NAD+)|nr:NAD-dependent DNA ligase LigA [Treponema sp.]
MKNRKENRDTIKNRTDTLERLILRYQKSYYDGEAEISDGEFDLLWDELKSIAPDSPVIKKIGGGGGGVSPAADSSVDGFPKAQHLMPMGSQEKAANPEEFRAWALKHHFTQFLVQYKLDGASLELQYEKGKLIKAITRGDGITGDEITANARRMSGVPEKLDIPFSGGVRGEVVMTHEVWRNTYASKANCRNAANGIMRRKDGSGCEDLMLITYDAAFPGKDRYFTDESHKVKWLGERGFETTVTKIFNDAEAVIAYRKKVAQTRDKLPFDIDGLVVKDIATDMADLRRARPEKQIAFKFELETAFSVLRQVEWSESGATYTPIGVVDPVRIAGTTVQRANLNNPGMIRLMGLKIGAAVSVVKRGEIIPKIEGLAPPGAVSSKAEEQEIEFPVRCAVCGAGLVDEGTRLYCPNAGCPKRLLHRLEKWVAVLDIRELGEKLLRQLFDRERVRHISDLYTLGAEELAAYERMGDLSAAKVIRHIRMPRELSLAAFIAGFDFEGIAETTMEKVAAAGFNTMAALRGASVEDLAAVYGLGEITAGIIVEGMKETAAEMDAVLQAGVISIAAPPPEDSQPLRGISFCFTGELSSLKRNEAEERIRALGASAKTSVVKDLSYLVTNDPGSGSGKNKKARELGIPIIDEEEFVALLAHPHKAGSAPAAPVQGELF